MKIRNGFVSNSSSSSFVVVFPKIPTSVEDVKNIIFSEDEEYFYSPYDSDRYPIMNVSQTVWNDICDQKVNDFDKAEEEFKNGSIDDIDAPDYNNFTYITDYHKRWKAYDDAKDAYAKKKFNEFFNTRKLKLKKINNENVNNMALYIFEYSDNDGPYFCSLEHGNLFKRLKHIRISKH